MLSWQSKNKQTKKLLLKHSNVILATEVFGGQWQALPPQSCREGTRADSRLVQQGSGSRLGQMGKLQQRCQINLPKVKQLENGSARIQARFRGSSVSGEA